MFKRNFTVLILTLIIVAGCKTNSAESPEVEIASLRNVPAQRLNYRFETDVPAPSQTGETTEIEDRNESVVADFDQSRIQEVLDRTITSPDKLRVLAVYRKLDDLVTEFRLDMYTSDGKLLKKITHEEMAVHFPGTIVWSPDSTGVAFIAMFRGGRQAGSSDPKTVEDTPKSTPDAPESAPDVSDAQTPDLLEPPKDILTFRTEQIYICNSEGGDIKPLTQNEGLMYFYSVWAPDSSSLIALASPFTEWQIREMRMSKAGERFVPAGRPRLIEKNGRERLLDDYPTSVHPVWSPDSAKVAVAFNRQIRIYDIKAEGPTQAAILLRNQLLLAAKAYEEKLRKEEEAEANSNIGDSGNTNDSDESNSDKEKNASSETNKSGSEQKNANVDSNVNTPTTTLPDARNLVAFNPIINLIWESETMLYLETGYIKNYADNELLDSNSYLRWHRLILSPQAIQVPADFQQ